MNAGVAQAMRLAPGIPEQHEVESEHLPLHRLVGQIRALTDRVPEIHVHCRPPRRAETRTWQMAGDIDNMLSFSPQSVK